MNQKTRLIIIRHGNTFLSGETPRRVGAKTDIPLVPSGIVQAKALAESLRLQDIRADLLYTGPLKRTRETAAIIKSHTGWDCPIEINEGLIELDYGPDENQPESLVVARIGNEALQNWEKYCLPPSGWHVNVSALLSFWSQLSQTILREHRGQTIGVITSNGIARFATSLLKGGLEAFAKQASFKLATGAYSIFEVENKSEEWKLQSWNQRPEPLKF